MPATVPTERVGRSNETHISFMNECGSLQRLSRIFVGKPGGRELAKLIVDKWQKPLGRAGIAALR